MGRRHWFASGSAADIAQALQSPYESPEQEKNDRSQGGNADRAEIKLPRGYRSEPEEASAEPAADESADDAEENRDDTTGRVPPWYQKLGQRPGDETKKNPVEPERQPFLPARLNYGTRGVERPLVAIL